MGTYLCFHFMNFLDDYVFLKRMYLTGIVMGVNIKINMHLFRLESSEKVCNRFLEAF